MYQLACGALRLANARVTATAEVVLQQVLHSDMPAGHFSCCCSGATAGIGDHPGQWPCSTHLRTVTLIGTAVPPPPQLRHFITPDRPHVLHPTSPSDHRVQ